MKNIYRYLKATEARRAFHQSPSLPEWLDADMLETLHNSYPYPPFISYDPKDREISAEKKAKIIIHMLASEASEFQKFLEIGCSEGVICAALARKGKFAVGIDIRNGFNKGENHSASYSQMNASGLGFKNDCFDFIFSIASFEHFSDPKGALDEAIRVVRKGGYIYLHYGPLYLSSYGLHAYRSLTLPYCQCLFDKETLINFCRGKNLNPPDFASLNQWTLEDFWRLWDMNSSRLRKVRYYEYLNADHVDLITRYPYCFKSKTNYFRNLIVPEIEVLFQKT